MRCFALVGFGFGFLEVGARVLDLVDSLKLGHVVNELDQAVLVVLGRVTRAALGGPGSTDVALEVLLLEVEGGQLFQIILCKRFSNDGNVLDVHLGSRDLLVLDRQLIWLRVVTLFLE